MDWLPTPRGLFRDPPAVPQIFGIHWLNRKNWCSPEIGLVTTFCPLTTTGTVELVVQTVGDTFVEVNSVAPTALVGQVTTTMLLEIFMLNGDFKQGA